MTPSGPKPCTSPGLSASAGHGDDLVTFTNLRANQLQNLSIDVVLGKVDRLNAILLAQEVRDLLIGNRAEPSQRVAQADIVVLLVLLRFAQLLEADSLLAYEELAQSISAHTCYFPNKIQP